MLREILHGLPADRRTPIIVSKVADHRRRNRDSSPGVREALSPTAFMDLVVE